MWGFSSLKDILDVVMIPVTLSLIAPWITQRWQNRQRDTQIKTQLIAEISGLVMTTIMTVHLLNAGYRQQIMTNDNQESELDRVYKKWRADTCVIGSKLHAYFPDKEKGDMQIHEKWKNFSNQLTQYYEDSRAENPKKSGDGLKKEKENLFEIKATIIEEILASKITGFKILST